MINTALNRLSILEGTERFVQLLPFNGVLYTRTLLSTYKLIPSPASLRLLRLCVTIFKALCSLKSRLSLNAETQETQRRGGKPGDLLVNTALNRLSILEGTERFVQLLPFNRVLWINKTVEHL